MLKYAKLTRHIFMKENSFPILKAPILTLIFTLSACQQYGHQEHKAKTVNISTTAPTVFDFLNQTYTLEGVNYKLKAGTAIYIDPQIKGASAKSTLRFVKGIKDDMNQDGLEDAVAITVLSTAGTGAFYHIHAFLNNGTAFTATDPLFIGDRVNIKDLTKAPADSDERADIIIGLEFKDGAYNQGKSVPIYITRTYNIRNGTLVQQDQN